MMHSPYNLLDCFAAQEARAISHEFLKNCIRAQDNSFDLIETLLHEKEESVPLYSTSLDRLGKLCESLGDPELGYSPAQLIDKLPVFARFDREKRRSMKTKIHAQFREDFEVELRERRLRDCVCVFRERMSEFLLETPMDMRSRHISLDSATAELILELRTLPRGIWLWPTE